MAAPEVTPAIAPIVREEASRFEMVDGSVIVSTRNSQTFPDGDAVEWWETVRLVAEPKKMILFLDTLRAMGREAAEAFRRSALVGKRTTLAMAGLGEGPLVAHDADSSARLTALLIRHVAHPWN